MNLAASSLIFLFSLLGYLPLRLRQAVGRSLGYLYGCYPSKNRQIAILHFKKFLPELQSKELSKRMFASIGQSIFELFRLCELAPSESGVLYEFDDPGALERLKARDGAKVFLTAHTGNWELLGLLAQAHAIALAAIGAQTRSSLLRPVLEWIRKESGVKTLWRGRSGAQDILSALQAGISIAGVIDQDTRVRGILLPFFGKDAHTPCTLVNMALEQKFPLYSVFIFRVAPKHFRIFLAPLEGMNTEEVLSEYNTRLETCVRMFPEQWVWFHKRWRSKGNGQRMSGNLYIQALQSEISQ